MMLLFTFLLRTLMGMGLDLSIRRDDDQVTTGDDSWLGSKHGTDTAESITCDGDAFLARFPTGLVPQGVVVAKRTADGLYVPYDNAADVDPVAAGQQGGGIDVARGHLLTDMNLRGTTAGTVGNVGGALFWHGQVIIANLPAGHGLDAAARADLTLIHYV